MSDIQKLIEGLRRSSAPPAPAHFGAFGCHGCTDDEREEAADIIAALVAERDALLAPFQHIDALDWDYILNLMSCNVRHPQDAQNLIWLDAMKAFRAALSPSHVEGK